MNVLSQLALSLALAVAVIAGWFRFERWYALRRIRKLYAEILDVARRSGFSDEELATRCERCGRFSLGLDCPYCD